MAPTTAPPAPLTLQGFLGGGCPGWAKVARCELYRKEANLGAHAPSLRLRQKLGWPDCKGEDMGRPVFNAKTRGGLGSKAGALLSLLSGSGTSSGS
eukprot:1158378-Pelagomonas_calceolata.AAC.2